MLSHSVQISQSRYGMRNIRYIQSFVFLGTESLGSGPLASITINDLQWIAQDVPIPHSVEIIITGPVTYHHGLNRRQKGWFYFTFWQTGIEQLI